jgi:hypothetical protein
MGYVITTIGKRLKLDEITRRKAEMMAILGYLGVFGLFIGMIILCFFWGVWEYKKSKDPGPLFINLDRTIKKRLRDHVGSLSKVPPNSHSSGSRKTLVLAESSELPQVSSQNETVRIRGDVRIPKGEVIPYNIVVEGNLISQEDVTFQGGLHVEGLVVIGARNRIKKSLVCQKELFLFEDVIVYNCIDSEGPVFIRKGVRVGVGEDGGGIASANKIYLENAEGPLKIHSAETIRIVNSFETLIPEDLKQIIEV